MTTKQSGKGKGVQPCDVYCPNCGFPHTAKATLREYMKKRKTEIAFKCRACGFAVMLQSPEFVAEKNKSSGKSKSETKDALKDVDTALGVVSKGKTLVNLFK